MCAPARGRAQHKGASARHMPPKDQQAAGKPYRGGRAGFKQRKRNFYNAQDRIIEEGRRLFGIRVGRVEFDNVSDEHFELALNFADVDDVGRYSERLYHIGVQAPWQNGVAERSGGTLKAVAHALVTQHTLLGAAQMAASDSPDGAAGAPVSRESLPKGRKAKLSRSPRRTGKA